MEAGGAASDKSDAQYASKYNDLHIKEQCDSVKEVLFCDPLAQEITNVCYDNVWPITTDIGPIGISKGVSYKRGPWTKAEDVILRKMVEELGPNDWVKVEMQSGLNRTSKSCRLRWKNHLQPNLKKGCFSLKEERDVIRMHYRYGNKWSLMAKRLPGRSDNEIKNLWHSRIKKCKKRGLPLYPEWCQEEDKTLNDDELCRSCGETIEVANSLTADQETINCSSYYPSSASTNETMMIKTSPSIKSPETEFRFPVGNAQNLQCPPLSSMDFSPTELFPSFQHFLSPRPKTLPSSSSTFSTSVASTPDQLPCKKLRKFSNAPTFEALQCPPLLSSPPGRFTRFPGATLVKPTEVPYSNSTATETPLSPLRLNISSSNEGISDNNTHLLDALLQDAQVDSCLSDLRFVEQCLFSNQFNTPHHLYDKILRRKEYNSIRELSSGRNLSSREVPSNASLLKSMDFLGKSQHIGENCSVKESEGSEGAMSRVLLGTERLGRPCLKRKVRMDNEGEECYSSTPNIQSGQSSVEDLFFGQNLKNEDLAGYHFDFPLGDTRSSAWTL